MNDKLKALYNRVSCDPSQLQKFVQELCEALGNGEEGFVTVNSEGATEGQVLTADGKGGTKWKEASGGDFSLNDLKLTHPEEGYTRIEFPLGIIPVKINIDSDYFYFHYSSECLVNASGVDMASYEVYSDDKSTGIVLYLEDTFELNQIYSCTYWKKAGGEDDFPLDNTYNILNPKVLYKHNVKIEINGQPDDYVRFSFITSDQTQLSKNNIRNLLSNHSGLIDGNFGCHFDDVNAKYYPGMIHDIYVNTSNYGFQIQYNGSTVDEISINNNSYVTDTVTPL